MKESGIFYDSANIEGLEKWYKTGVLGGATTNPVILQKEGVLNVPEHIEKMIEVTDKKFPISIEVPDSTMTKSEMIELALKYRDRFPGNAVIKIPMDAREPQKAYEVMYKLSEEGVRVNATLGLTAGQLILAGEALRKSKDSFISLFWGRCEEAGGTGAVNTLTTTIKYLQTHSLASKIIIGSIRSVAQIEQAFALGADIVTIPPKLLEEWLFTQRGVETADQFNQTYRDVSERIKLI